MINKYMQSQSGAALILILFVVLFLSIVGTVLLNTTTYSQKSIVNNFALEKEFYLAEGALDIVLNDIYNNPALYNELKMMDLTSYREMFESTPGNYKKIGSTPMSVKLKKISENTDSLTVELTAGYANNGKKDRVLEVEILNPIGDVSSHTIFYSGGVDPLKFPSTNGKKTHALILGVETADVIYYENIYQNFYNYFITERKGGNPKKLDFSKKVENKALIIPENSTEGSVFIFDDDISTSNVDITITANTIVFFDGKLSQNGQANFNIEKGAILLVNNLVVVNGNNAINNVDGALVVNSFSASSNGLGINMNVDIGENAGIKCGIIDSIPGLSGMSGCGPITPQTKLQYKIVDYKTQ